MQTLWDVISVTCVFIVVLLLIGASFGFVKVRSDLDED